MTEFERLFSENKDFIFKFLIKLTKNHSIAEELTGETFFRAYMNYASLRNKEKAPVWLCQIAKNTYYAWCREQKNIEPFEDNLDYICDPYDIEDEFIRKDLSEKAIFNLHQLEEPYKEVFMLSVFAGLSLAEISKVFGKSESWARVTFYRAKQKLLERMR